MILRILPSAIGDLEEGRQFYEKREAGLGQYFFDSIAVDIESLQETAGVHRKSFDFHRLICRRFPFSVYYTVENQTVFIWRILDARRNPRRIAGALRGLVR